MSKSKLIQVYKTWHRRAGIISAVFVVFLSVTGILLNHTSELGLGKQAVNSPWLLSLYGQAPAAVESYTLYSPEYHEQPRWVSGIAKQIFVDEQNVYQCDSSIKGAYALEDMWLLACEQSLVLFTYDMQVVEALTATYGLPVPIDGVLVCGTQVCIKSNSETFQFDTNTMVIEPYVDEYRELDLIHAVSNLPKSYLHAIRHQYSGASLDWERIVLDVHAGRFMGPLGPWLMDLVALLFLVLAFSGLVLWLKIGRKQKNKKKRLSSLR